MDSDLESKLLSLISQLIQEITVLESTKMVPLIIQIISLVKSIDFESKPKPHSKLISLITQTIFLINTIDFKSMPKPLSKLISIITQTVSMDSDNKSEFSSKFMSLLDQTLDLKPDPELVSHIRRIVSFVVYTTNSKFKKLVSLCPQVQVILDEEGEFDVIGDVKGRSKDKLKCFLGKCKEFVLKNGTHFRCRSCNGVYHEEEYEKAPLEIKHPLHPRHDLHLVLLFSSEKRACYCCDEVLERVFYLCFNCDFAINIACLEKPRVLTIDHPKWHEHTLALFPRQTSLTCNVCALTNSTTCPFYMCPPCDFVIHQSCISLPRVVRISRHPHRMGFISSFDQGDWSCGVCRTKIDNDYRGYSCIKDDCYYVAHSKCATQSNVWDDIDLEGVLEETEEEEVEPFVRISDGIIRHFSHDHHHLRLDENTSKDYDENKQCEACVTPIYFGNFYSCVECDFILHETCANLSRKKYHPIHPHILTLSPVGGNEDVMDHKDCSACCRFLGGCFKYECVKEDCNFWLHVQCAAISEPLAHESHVHPLFLTSKPGVTRPCHVCTVYKTETFNCIECDDFALCFRCASLPPKVRYKHDKHILALSYGEENNTMTYWCEACETEINTGERFYMCDENCCVTLHVDCLIGRDLYRKPGSSFLLFDEMVVRVLLNKHHMTRPLCSNCKKRCPQTI
ncbi:unnamed protein product, partial [Cochlearia groenlandica]